VIDLFKIIDFFTIEELKWQEKKETPKEILNKKEVQVEVLYITKD